MPETTELDHTILRVRDCAASIRFYEDVLGFVYEGTAGQGGTRPDRCLVGVGPRFCVEFRRDEASSVRPRPDAGHGGSSTRSRGSAASAPSGVDEAGTFPGVYPPWVEGPRGYYPLPSIKYEPHYDTFMINGKSSPDTDPVLVKTGEVLRARVINAGQMVHTVHLQGHHFLVTHKDGYPLASPFYADSPGLFPGERYDFYVRAYNPGHWHFHDHGGSAGLGTHEANDYAFPGGAATMLVCEDFTMPNPLPAPQVAGGAQRDGRMAGAHAGHG